MNWYLQSGKESDVAINTKIELSRNINEFKFNLENEEEIEKLNNKIYNNISNIGYNFKFLKLEDMDNITIQSLVEKKLITQKFAKKKRKKETILINDDENICIMVNSNDHLVLQFFSSGLDIKNTLNLAIEIDTKIGEILQYSISEKYGYLTTCPSNVGTGLKASVRLHLPGLTKTNNIKKILEIVNTFGINAKIENGNIYEISNQKTLGITEEEIVTNLNIVSEKIINQERNARKILEGNNIELEDRVYRCFGILSNCKKISSKEVKELLSDIKLGTDLGIIPELTDLKVLKIYLYTKPSNLQKYYGKNLEKLQRDIKRAELIKQIIKD